MNGKRLSTIRLKIVFSDEQHSGIPDYTGLILSRARELIQGTAQRAQLQNLGQLNILGTSSRVIIFLTGVSTVRQPWRRSLTSLISLAFPLTEEGRVSLEAALQRK